MIKNKEIIKREMTVKIGINKVLLWFWSIMASAYMRESTGCISFKHDFIESYSCTLLLHVLNIIGTILYLHI